MSEILSPEFTSTERRGPPNRRLGPWIGLLVAFVVLIVAVAMIGLRGTESPAAGGSANLPSGSPEVITASVPAYIQEAIVYGERDPSAVMAGVEIMPVYLIEASYFED